MDVLLPFTFDHALHTGADLVYGRTLSPFVYHLDRGTDIRCTPPHLSLPTHHVLRHQSDVP